MSEKSYPGQKHQFFSGKPETQGHKYSQRGDDNLIFHPLCLGVLHKNLRANLEKLAIARGEAMASTKDMIRRVKGDSNRLAPQQAKEVLAALDQVQAVLEAIGTSPLSATEEGLDILRETVRLLRETEQILSR